VARGTRCRLISQSLPDTGRDLLAGTRQFLLSNQILIITAIILLLLWPLLARPWDRLWSGWPGPDERQPWRPYLAAAVLPVALLALSLAPLPASYARHGATPANCSQLLAWQGGPGFGDKVQAETDINSLLGARTPADAQADFGALMAATAAMTVTPKVMAPMVSGMLVEPGGATVAKIAGSMAVMVVPTFCPMDIAETRLFVWKSSGYMLGKTAL